jgi:uncharacterized membrane protein
VEVVTEAAPVVIAPAAETSLFSQDVLLIAGTIMLVAIVAGAFLLAFEALKALKVSVPQEVLAAWGKVLLDTMQKTMDGVQTSVNESATPIDDAVYSVGKIPLMMMMHEITRRTGLDIPPELLMAASADPIPAVPPKPFP